MMRFTFIGLLVLLALSQVACTKNDAPTPLALVGASLIDGTGASAVEDAIIVIHNGLITAAGASDDVEIPKSAEVLDYSGRWILPGLIESNGHVVFDGQIDHAVFFSSRQNEYYDIGAANLRTALTQGITTIRDTHGPTSTLLKLRKAVAEGQIIGSRLFTAGAILNYESLLDIPTDRTLDAVKVNRARADLDRFIKGSEDGSQMVEELASLGVDFVKISLSGRPFGEPLPNKLSDEAVEAMLDKARQHGLRTTSHTMNLLDLERAVTLGFNALEHPEFILDRGKGVSMPQELASEIADRGIYSVPLIVAMEVYITFLEDPSLLDDPLLQDAVHEDIIEDARRWVEREASNPAILEARKARYNIVRENLRTLITAGAAIAMGTDKGTRFNYHEHANHVRELQIYVELGMTPLEAIHSATLRGAELLGVADRLGSLQVGKEADLIVLEADPQKDLQALREVLAVFKAGVIVATEE